MAKTLNIEQVEMTKSRRRDSIKSLLWTHMDPGRDEQLQGTKIGDFLYPSNELNNKLRDKNITIVFGNGYQKVLRKGTNDILMIKNLDCVCS